MPGSRVLADARMQAFILGWDWHALRHAPLGVFHPPIFHPEPRVLTYMDHLLGETLLAAPLLAAFPTVAPAYNFLVLVSFVASGWAVYRLARLLPVGRVGAVLAGFLFAFSPFRFGILDYMNQLQTQFLVLGLFFGMRYVQRQRARDLIAVAAVVLIQFYFGLYYTFFLALELALLAVWAMVLLRRGIPRAHWALAAGLTAAVALLSLPVAMPYLQQSRAMPEYHRTPGEIQTHSASLLGYVRVNRNAWIASWLPHARYDQPYWPGLVTLALAAVGSVHLLRRRPRDPAQGARRAAGLFFLALAAVAFVLSLGPYLLLPGHRPGPPLPYAALHALIPALSSLRAPGRLAVLVLLGLTMLAGLGYERLRAARWGSRAGLRSAAAAAVFGLAALTVWQRPAQLVEVPSAADMPPVYEWLARQPGRPPILELPGPSQPHTESERDILRQFYVLYHGKPRLDGSSGFVSRRYREFRVVIRGFPGEDALRAAAGLGAALIVVHFGDYAPGERAALRVKIAAERRLVPLSRFGDDEVYRLSV